MDESQQKVRKLHIERLEQYPYLWNFRFSNGSTRVIGSENDKAPLGIASRVGNQSGYGHVVSSHKMPKEAREAYIREAREDLERRKKLNTIEKLGLFNQNNTRIDPEISKNDIPVEDIISEEEADEELIGHIIALQSALGKVPKTLKGSERLFVMASDADEDEDYSEFMAQYARSLQKKFSEVVNDVDRAFEAIIENLEGA